MDCKCTCFRPAVAHQPGCPYYESAQERPLPKTGDRIKVTFEGTVSSVNSFSRIVNLEDGSTFGYTDSIQMEVLRMPEPTEFGSNVTALDPVYDRGRETWVRINNGQWINTRGHHRQWSQLNDPRPV